MPVSLAPFTSRREADRAISRSFGAAGCSTHSPNAERPGPLSTIMSEGFAALGYPVAGSATLPGNPGHLLEVYPHTALLALLGAKRRVPYKVQKNRKYWPELEANKRREKLLAQYDSILAALGANIAAIPLQLPTSDGLTFSGLKRYEDCIDALICGWAGICYLNQQITPFGDLDAAIWVPSPNAGRSAEDEPLDFVCPECKCRKSAGSLMVNRVPMKTDPWSSVLQIIFCEVCDYGIPAHLGYRWNKISLDAAQKEWREVYRLGAKRYR